MSKRTQNLQRFKAKAVLETFEGEETVSEPARRLEFTLRRGRFDACGPGMDHGTRIARLHDLVR